MNFLNKLFITFIVINLIAYPTFALTDIDLSVDEDIRKKYNPNRIEEDLLPPLPDNLQEEIDLKSTETTIPKTNTSTSVPQTSNNVTLKEVQLPKTNGQKITLKRGTKFTVRSVSAMSDRMRVGAKIYFKLSKPIQTRYFTLPENTRFTGVVVDSHPPQLSGNGGLLVIRIDNVIINGRTQEINAKVTKAQYKKIFFNNIKGKRSYLKGIEKTTKPGKRFYDKTWAATKHLAKNNITLIFTPITFIAGTVVYGVNIIGSPLFAMFTKGGSLSIPANSVFELKLLESTTMYN